MEIYDYSLDDLLSNIPIYNKYYSISRVEDDSLFIHIKQGWLIKYEQSGFSMVVNNSTRLCCSIKFIGKYSFLPVNFSGFRLKRLYNYYCLSDFSEFTTIKDFLEEVKTLRDSSLSKLEEFKKLIRGKSLSEYLGEDKDKELELLLRIYLRFSSKISTFQELICIFYKNLETFDKKGSLEDLISYSPPPSIDIDPEMIREAIFEYKTIVSGVVTGLFIKYGLPEKYFQQIDLSWSDKKIFCKLLSRLYKDSIL